MNKEESLSFLQSCIDKVNYATEQDINLFQKNYELDCAIPSGSSVFEFVFPMSIAEPKYEIKNVYELAKNGDSFSLSGKYEVDYKFIGQDIMNQQSSDTYSHAA